jgi:hypothetical protein
VHHCNVLIGGATSGRYAVVGKRLLYMLIIGSRAAENVPEFAYALALPRVSLILLGISFVREIQGTSFPVIRRSGLGFHLSSDRPMNTSFRSKPSCPKAGFRTEPRFQKRTRTRPMKRRCISYGRRGIAYMHSTTCTSMDIRFCPRGCFPRPTCRYG